MVVVVGRMAVQGGPVRELSAVYRVRTVSAREAADNYPTQLSYWCKGNFALFTAIYSSHKISRKLCTSLLVSPSAAATLTLGCQAGAYTTMF